MYWMIDMILADSEKQVSLVGYGIKVTEEYGPDSPGHVWYHDSI